MDSKLNKYINSRIEECTRLLKEAIVALGKEKIQGQLVRLQVKKYYTGGNFMTCILDESKKQPTHVVMVGYFKDSYTWATKFCVPFFSKKDAVKYRKKILENVDFRFSRVLILPYEDTN